MVKHSKRAEVNPRDDKWMKQLREELSVQKRPDVSGPIPDICPLVRNPVPPSVSSRTNQICSQSKPATELEKKRNVLIHFDVSKNISVLRDIKQVFDGEFQSRADAFLVLFRQTVLIKPSFKWTEQRETTTTTTTDSCSCHSWAV